MSVAMSANAQTQHVRAALAKSERRRLSFHKASRPGTAFSPETFKQLPRVSSEGGSSGRANDGKAAVASPTGAAASSAALSAADQALGFAAGRELFAAQNVRPLLAWANPHGIGPGFHNLGNTCFLNATLQCLCYLPPLAQLLLRTSYAKTPATLQSGELRRVDMLGYIESLSKAVHGSGSGGGRTGAISPKNIASNIRIIGKQFKIGRQEDAHEFLRHLVDHMAEACLRRAGIKTSSGGHGPGPPPPPHRLAETTAIHRVFGGYLRSRVSCTKCGFCSDTFDLSMDLSLELSGGVKSLEQALARFTAPETLDAANRWRCGGCRKMVCAHKQLSVFKAPNVLVVHFKRFAYGRTHGKVGRIIAFPERLRLPVSGPDGTASYLLTGVVVHQGNSMQFGHYFSYVKASTGAWHHMDDAHTRQVSRETVLAQPAYLLFYTRLPAPKLPPAAATAATAAAAPASAAAGATATAAAASAAAAVRRAAPTAAPLIKASPVDVGVPAALAAATATKQMRGERAAPAATAAAAAAAAAAAGEAGGLTPTPTAMPRHSSPAKAAAGAVSAVLVASGTKPLNGFAGPAAMTAPGPAEANASDSSDASSDSSSGSSSGSNSGGGGSGSESVSAAPAGAAAAASAAAGTVTSVWGAAFAKASALTAAGEGEANLSGHAAEQPDDEWKQSAALAKLAEAWRAVRPAAASKAKAAAAAGSGKRPRAETELPHGGTPAAAPAAGTAWGSRASTAPPVSPIVTGGKAAVAKRSKNGAAGVAEPFVTAANGLWTVPTVSVAPLGRKQPHDSAATAAATAAVPAAAEVSDWDMPLEEAAKADNGAATDSEDQSVSESEEEETAAAATASFFSAPPVRAAAKAAEKAMAATPAPRQLRSSGAKLFLSRSPINRLRPGSRTIFSLSKRMSTSPVATPRQRFGLTAASAQKGLAAKAGQWLAVNGGSSSNGKAATGASPAAALGAVAAVAANSVASLSPNLSSAKKASKRGVAPADADAAETTGETGSSDSTGSEGSSNTGAVAGVAVNAGGAAVQPFAADPQAGQQPKLNGTSHAVAGGEPSGNGSSKISGGGGSEKGSGNGKGPARGSSARGKGSEEVFVTGAAARTPWKPGKAAAGGGYYGNGGGSSNGPLGVSVGTWDEDGDEFGGLDEAAAALQRDDAARRAAMIQLEEKEAKAERGKRKNDGWNAMLDAGHVRKVKAPKLDSSGGGEGGGVNPFQKIQLEKARKASKGKLMQAGKRSKF